MMKDFSAEYKERTETADRIVLRHLPEIRGEQKLIMESMDYAVRAGGKRLRPLMLMTVYEMFINDPARDRCLRPVMEAAMAAIEMIHTFSLCHDDLPCMDNDRYRRGQESVWFRYGEDFGTLAGDALSLYAFECIGDAFEKARAEMRPDSGVSAEQVIRWQDAVLRTNRILAGQSGIHGMLGGQVVDVEMTGGRLTEEQLMFVYRLKTGALIAASFLAGAVLAGAGDQDLEALSEAAFETGIAFQIRDDILDETSTDEELGKPVHSDMKDHLCHAAWHPCFRGGGGTALCKGRGPASFPFRPGTE